MPVLTRSFQLRCSLPALVLYAALAAPVTAAADTSFTLVGHGYGHGVGLSQYGADAMAAHGATAAQILQRYYPGTDLAPAPASTVRVLVQQTAHAVALHAGAPLHLRDASGRSTDVPPAQTVTVTRNGSTFDVAGAGVTGGAAWSGPVVATAAGGAPITVEGNAPAGGAGHSYRGALRIAADGGFVDAVDVVALDDYVRGVVPSEMPSSWPAAALQAQAVAARSYALATSQPDSRPFDVYADTRSQVYGGVTAETAATSAAVQATAGQIAEYAGHVATTFFSSSNGGRTADPVEAGVTTKPVPYLRESDDPNDATSPYHDWTVTLGAAKLADALHYTGTIQDLSVDAYPSGRVQALVVDGSAGTLSVSGPKARLLLGLRSTWFAVQTALALQAPRVTSSRVRISGSAPDGPVTLQGGDGSHWRTLASASASGGQVSFLRRLGEAARYRLLAAGQRSNVIAVSAAAGLVLRPHAGVLRGRLYPQLASRLVVLQRRSAGTWRTVDHARTTRGGAFGFHRAPPAVYRASFAGDTILRAATSAVVDTRLAHAPRRLQGTARAGSFAPNDPLYGRQWNLREINAFGYFASPPFDTLAPVTVAIIDGGVDATVRDLKGVDIVEHDFAGNPHPPLDHGTAIAGIIAADVDNGYGVAGIDPSVRLLDLRVVGPDGEIDPVVEAKAIGWAVAHSQGQPLVINLSLGGTRDPLDRAVDEYSPIEKHAIYAAYRAGAVLVAPTGNGDGESPYPYASYPAALPHVLGVSADDHGEVASFSNRDDRYNDLAAPGVDIVTTVSRATAASGLSANAVEGGLVDASGTLRGTSFAAPHVTAAAALLLGLHPKLQNAQVMRLLEGNARQLGSPATGPGLRDPASGFGVLDIGAALTAAQYASPPPDRGEPNEDLAHALPLQPGVQTAPATVDWGDDPWDSYRVNVARGQTFQLRVDTAGGGLVQYAVYRPGAPPGKDTLVAESPGAGGAAHARVSFTAPSGGTYLVQVIAVPGSPYTAYRILASG